MKQLKFLLKGSIVLFVIGIFITMAQISCTKSDAQSAKPAGVTRQPLVLLQLTYSSAQPPNTIWLMNADGTNYHSVVLQGLPSNIEYNTGLLTPDGTHIIYSTNNTTNGSSAGIYNSTIQGDSTVQILPANSNPAIIQVSVADVK